jgi:hypothetical protein
MSDDNVEITPVETNAEPVEAEPVDPKEVKRLAFQKETAELVARNKKETEAAAKAAEAKAKKKEPADQLDETEIEEPEEKEEKKAETTQRKHKLVIDGVEVEHDESEVIRLAQIARASQNREHLATKTAKQAIAFVKALKENPEDVLSHKSLGIDLEALAEKVLWNKMQERLKTPEQREAEQTEAERKTEKEELEAYRKEKADRKAQADNERLETLKEQKRQEWSQKFTDALDTGDVPRTDWTLTRMAHYMRIGLKTNPNIEPKDVVHLVEADWDTAHKQMLGKLKGDKLIKRLGDDVADEVRKTQLKRFEDKDESGASGDNAQPKDKIKKYGSVEEMLR